MIEAGRWHQLRAPAPLLTVGRHRESNQKSLLRSVVVAGLLIMLILSPVQFVVLPLNLSVVELWNGLLLPVAWLYLIRVRQPIRLPYIAAMWLILLGSFIGTFSAPSPMTSLIAILKEVYLYVWFVTLVALLVNLGATMFRRFMLVWSAIVLLHGILVIAQFLSPEIFRETGALAARFGALDHSRPSGLFENANATALFQLMGFVPLLLILARVPRYMALLLPMVLLASTVATGSLGATSGFLVGLTIAGITLPFVAGGLGPSIRIFRNVAVASLLLGGLIALLFLGSPDFSARFDYLFLSRAEGSAEGRFDIWQRGLEVISSETSLWGIGPNAYKDVDLFNKMLHNDLLSFIVERGVLGALGLCLFVALAMAGALRLLLRQKRAPDALGLAVVVFLAAILAASLNSQFHQIFHQRSIWLVLAIQEALLLRQVVFQRGPAQPDALVNDPRRHLPELHIQRHISRR